MRDFPKITVQGAEYVFDHLRPHSFTIVSNGTIYAVEVVYSCHVFTEARSAQTTPDLFYTHDGEERAFCPIRYEMSLSLSNLIATHDARNVYLSNRENYFIVNAGKPQSYYVFFEAMQVTKSRLKKGIDVILHVRSAHFRVNEIKQAPAIKLTTLVQLTATGQKVPRGNKVVVRIRN